MKTCPNKAIVLALAAAIFCAPGGLLAEDDSRRAAIISVSRADSPSCLTRPWAQSIPASTE